MGTVGRLVAFCQRFNAAGLSLRESIMDSVHTDEERTILGGGERVGKKNANYANKSWSRLMFYPHQDK